MRLILSGIVLVHAGCMFTWVKCYCSFQREVLLYGLTVIRHDNKVAKVLVSDGKVCSPEDLISENGVQRYGDSDDDVPTDGVPVDCICDDGVPTDGALILLVNTRKDLCFYIRHDNKAVKDLFSDSSKLGRLENSSGLPKVSISSWCDRMCVVGWNADVC